MYLFYTCTLKTKGAIRLFVVHVASRYELCGFHWKCFIPKFWRYLLTTAAFSLFVELRIDESDSNRFIRLLCRSSDSYYNSTDSLLVTVGYQLRFLALLCNRSADLACTWYSPTLTIRTSIIWTWDAKKCRVKVHIVTTWPACTCAVNLCRIVATREPAAALLSN